MLCTALKDTAGALEFKGYGTLPLALSRIGNVHASYEARVCELMLAVG